MSHTSSLSSSHAEPPQIPPDSPGSSVSTRLQDEYDELLKYAVVIPNYEVRPKPGVLASAKPTGDPYPAREDDIITVNARQQTSPGSTRDEEERTPQADRDSPGVQHLPDFGGQSPISGSHEHTPRLSRRSTQQDIERIVGANPRYTYQDVFPESTHRQYPYPSVSDRELPADNAHIKLEHQRKQTYYTATVDPDVAHVETMLDDWCLNLKRNILAEFSQAKLKVVTESQEEVRKETERFMAQKQAMAQEMDQMKELLNTYEETLKRKDDVISNLTNAVAKQRDKLEMMRKFSDWKAKHCDNKTEAFSTNLARMHYERVLRRRVMSAWFSLVQSKWRQHVEKACQNKAQEVCLQLTNDYEAKIASLNESLEATRQEVQKLHVEREKFEEAMKKAFMRGVCALNMEAMNIFDEGHGPRQADTPEPDENTNTSANFDSGLQSKVSAANKAMPPITISSTVIDDFQPKVVTSQGSRSTQTLSQPRQSSAKPSSSGTSVTSSGRRGTGMKPSGKAADANRSATRSTSPVLHPPMASVIVERHPPVNKQTIGHATASKFTKTSAEKEKLSRTPAERFQRLAGQGLPKVQTVRVVE